MPKKFIGSNTKSTAAKERKSLAKEESDMKKKLEKEESEWLDKCKKVEKKLERREAKMEKREEYLNRKKQLKALLKSESETLHKTSKSNELKKITKFAVNRNFELNKPIKTKQVNATDSLIENVNRLTLGEEIARTIDAALSLLGNNSVPDKHPEKRLKAAHKAYEETRIKELRQENPALKQTQLKEIVFKEWLRMQPKL